MKTNYIQDEAAKTLAATRTFTAPKHKVWEAYTTSDILDQWWAPAPWKAETKSMDFTEGGHWHYAMVGPEGEKHWALLHYQTITPEDNFTAHDEFSNEAGESDTTLPTTQWDVTFTEEGESTHMKVVIVFDSVEGMNKLTEMGMLEGFDMGLNQLEALLAN